MIKERINIVPILAADISKDTSSIINLFDEISFKKGTKGEFYIDFITNAIITKQYRIEYVLFRKSGEGIDVLYIDSFVIPPSEDFLNSRNASQKKVEANWSFGKGDIIIGHTKAKMSYDTISQTGEYGILAFGTEVKNEDDKVELTIENLICERHFLVNVE